MPSRDKTSSNTFWLGLLSLDRIETPRMVVEVVAVTELAQAPARASSRRGRYPMRVAPASSRERRTQSSLQIIS